MNISFLKIPVVCLFLAAGVTLFWFSAKADDVNSNDCVLCHKHFTTITVTCNSIDYRRHKDHGDPDGACTASAP